MRSACGVLEDAFTACLRQRVALQIEVLVIRRDARVSD
ncbi:hypothetical protein BURPS1106B_2350 [Burkholderia pseudomallei 1106b]|uniref:Uncharacterized protein n=2 Tax=Burkholderia pseudomallei TaxID=28450 RepID=A0A0E1W686_BURPE|nr:hypothetical protein BURPS1106A_A2825 [Burkholderia pseudomallei 1106a]EBA50534.1 hypothetical protein BURPS305_6446 [Burkholderia pseudomallei 305]EEH29962.1 conserved hypothetical protein [Burkholderia pseudomallei Pakistan 9]EEP50835.1 conserved hypothetical protein [Burkholderia pseudomallei MSHR346]EES23062.1 hypothetical protein BURPS1106B_2350 [Burkholderia pseudomallei 1106b]EET05162.1 hypothetical protein BURPS1710A_A2114 [Burkholderia pseudomallei 1710a]